ncbi:hypothetical protein BC829DRAFT_30925 [Chytridium lagenaria]|nr:hypothetical protein BC829DRAFT_30925 [Chytridium lagenaria]
MQWLGYLLLPTTLPSVQSLQCLQEHPVFERRFTLIYLVDTVQLLLILRIFVNTILVTLLAIIVVDGNGNATDHSRNVFFIDLIQPVHLCLLQLLPAAPWLIQMSQRIACFPSKIPLTLSSFFLNVSMFRFPYPLLPTNCSPSLL